MRQPRPTTIAAAALLLHWAGAASAVASSPATTPTNTSTKTTHTTSTTTSPTVYIASSAPTTGAAAATGIVRNYGYQGCYLDITGMNGTAPGARSLQGDTTDEVLPGDMTVAKCLSFCGGAGSGTAYTYAGLEYARECWCGQELSSLATKEAEAQCNLPCDGDNGTLCGGDLRLTVSTPWCSRRYFLFLANLIALHAQIAGDTARDCNRGDGSRCWTGDRRAAAVRGSLCSLCSTKYVCDGQQSSHCDSCRLSAQLMYAQRAHWLLQGCQTAVLIYSHLVFLMTLCRHSCLWSSLISFSSSLHRVSAFCLS